MTDYLSTLSRAAIEDQCAAMRAEASSLERQAISLAIRVHPVFADELVRKAANIRAYAARLEQIERKGAGT